ncbi:MAG: sigma-54 dependent transcriptional regulator [Planctomycetales bacterium]|nr:sigma-54 dependent transcriptional regulator [Planctomycetales bacterium]
MSEKSKKDTILVVDDVHDTVEVLQRNLASVGYSVYTAPGVAEALAIIESTPVDLVVTDFKMPKISGMDLVRHIRENHKDMEVIMITGYPSVAGAVTAVKTGAEEYLAKPFTDAELFAAVRQALDKLRRRRLGGPQPPGIPPASHGLIGQSEPMRKVLKMIGKVASSSATVLIFGESGTGKELVARAIHYCSPRAAAPLVPINCGGIPESLLESELFGYVKGAFTGATESRAGFFQTADGGTIFLDEISETSLNMQVKLLRVLQDREVYMVGSTRKRTIDVRVLASTNKSLPRLVEKGQFREDLYFRLNVVSIELPPLRDRGDDIVLLANHFCRKYSQELDKPQPQFTDEALQVLKNGYSWPGNVRELENVVHRLVVMLEGERIDVPDLPALMRFSISRQPDLTRALAEVEAEYIRNVLSSVGGNRTRAAEILAVDRKTLREKLKKMGK